MARALFNGKVVADSDTVEEVEGNLYFPPDAVDWSFFSDSPTVTHCPWKGDAHYYTLTVNGETETDAAWTYHDPRPAASAIKDHVAFWKRVIVER